MALQFAASRAGFQGPLHSLVSDYVATPKSMTVPWVGLGVAMVGLSTRARLVALSLAAAIDLVFAAERLLNGGAFALGNGPVIVLTGLTVLALTRWTGEQRSNALRAIAFAVLLILATKVGDTWLRITAIARPTVWDEYALLADHSLAQPSWLLGRLVDAAGPVFSSVLHWVYIELPAAALVVAVYQLRNVTKTGWPQHFMMRSFLVLGLVGPVIYILFPIVGPAYAFSAAGQGFQLGDFWSHALPPVDISPGAIAFDDQTARNCMPSMHTAWATAVFIHSRSGPRWLRWGGAFWLAGTLAATLGFRVPLRRRPDRRRSVVPDRRIRAARTAAGRELVAGLAGRCRLVVLRGTAVGLPLSRRADGAIPATVRPAARWGTGGVHRRVLRDLPGAASARCRTAPTR